jgi:hypothetical protein
MKHFFAFRMLTIALCTLLGTWSLSAQVFWTETFSDQASATARWTGGGTNPGTKKWEWTKDPLAGYQDPTVKPFQAPTATNGYFLFNSYDNGSFVYDVTLTSKDPIDCTGKTNVHVLFHTQFGKVDVDSKVYVGVSTDGTTFKDYEVLPNTIENVVYNDHIEVDLNEADNKSKVWLRFRWEGNEEYHWKIDDIQLTTNPPAVSCANNPDKLICDNFESYLLGSLSSQAIHWIPWGEQDNNGILSANVGSVVDTATQRIIASDGRKAMRVIYEINSAGSVQGDDQLLRLGNRSTGRYSLKWNMFVPKGKNAYYNLQHLQNPAVAAQTSDNWTLDVYFRADGTDSIANPQPYVIETFPMATWFSVEHVIDLDKNIAYLYIDGVLRRAWNYTKNLGSVDFYASDPDSEYYVDEVEFTRLPAIVENVDVCATATDLTNLTGGAVGVKKVSALFNNTTATPASTDPPIDCWNENKVNRSMWYTFIGDGNTYNIQTVPCNATNYIGTAQQDEGDTQMAVYLGNDCSNLTIVACNDDLYADGEPDWRASVEFATEKAKRYYILIDGYEDSGVVATGEFCVQMEQTTIKRCEDITIDPAATSTGLVCARDTVSKYIRTDLTKYNIVPLGEEHGMAWVISIDTIPQGVWPPSHPGFLASYRVLPTPYLPFLVNDSTFIPWNTRIYFTPVVIANGTVLDTTRLNFLSNIDSTGTCFKVGKSISIGLLPPLRPLTATVTSTNAVPPNNNGTATVTASGGFGTLVQNPNLYRFQWSNNSTSNRISNLAPGTYTVTVFDPTGCTPRITRSVVITSMVGVQDPASVAALTMTPNPTADQVLISLVLDHAATVRFEVVNTLGQVLQSIEGGTTMAIDQPLSLAPYQSGTYFIRVTVNGETAIRRVVLQK